MATVLKLFAGQGYVVDGQMDKVATIICCPLWGSIKMQT